MNITEQLLNLDELKWVCKRYPDDFSNLTVFDHRRLEIAVETIEFLMKENRELRNECQKS